MTGPVPSPAHRGALIVGAGLATGIVTQIGQGALPGEWSQLANAITPWLLVAFLLGSVMPDGRWAAAAGAGALLLALVGYYGMVQLRFGYGGGTSSWILWGAGALVGGPVYGLAGWWWQGPSHRRRAVAIGLLAAVAIAEGAYNVLVVDHGTVGVTFIVAGLIVPLVFGRSREDRLGAYVAMLPVLAVGGTLGYLAFIVVGLIVPLVFGRSREDRLGAYVAMLPVLAVGGTLGYLAFTWLASFTSGV